MNHKVILSCKSSLLQQFLATNYFQKTSIPDVWQGSDFMIRRYYIMIKVELIASLEKWWLITDNLKWGAYSKLGILDVKFHQLCASTIN